MNLKKKGTVEIAQTVATQTEAITLLQQFIKKENNWCEWGGRKKCGKVRKKCESPPLQPHQ